MRRRWQQLSSSPIALLSLAFPGVFLPLDLIFAGPGIFTYATRDQAARIFLYSTALAFLLSALAGVLAIALRLRARVIVVAALSLTALAVLHSVVLWSQYYTYSVHYQWLRHLAAVLLALMAGPLLARRTSARQLEGLGSVLRASTAVVAVVALACGLLSMAGADRAPAPAAMAQRTGGHPSIFLISIDTLSAMYLPIYGYPRETAPRLSEFAAEATLFRRNYANANLTTPSVNSILHGTRPWTHRALHIEARPLRATQARSLPALLGSAGYFTAAVATNPWAAPRNLGMQDYFSVVSENNVCVAADPLLVLTPELQVAVKSSLAWMALHSVVVWASDRLRVCEGRQFDPALAFAEARRILAAAPADRPLFLWIHLFPPHDPYVPPAPFLGTIAAVAQGRDRASTTPPYGYEAAEHLDFPGIWQVRYLEAIGYVDHHIGAFLHELKRRGLFAPSLIVVTADHGESFSKSYGAHGGPALHEDLVRVPLLIKEPGQRSPRAVEQLSEQADLLPTILELAGIASPSGTEGISLVPAMRGKAAQRAVFAMNFQQSKRLGRLDTGTVAMVEGRWKYVHYFGRIHYPFMPVLEDELYDLSADPHEWHNLVHASPALGARMREAIDAKLAEHGGPIE